MVSMLLTLLAGVQVASAHFGLLVPEWRGDSLENSTLDQYASPCAKALPNSGNRTEWPLTGGSIKLELHHAWDYIFINLGLGNNVTNFFISLTPQLLNSTGNGTLCIPKLTLPSSLSLTDGQQASVQVVTMGNRGQGLYNCADITFRANATTLSSDQCKATTNYTVIAQGASAPPATKPNAAVRGGSNVVTLASFAGLAVAFVYGVSL